MLEAARAAKREGQDVVIGLLSFDAWPSDPPLPKILRQYTAKRLHRMDTQNPN